MVRIISSSSCTRFAVALFAAIILGSLALAPVQAQRGRFNPDGSFWIVGQPPKGFADFDGMNLNSNRNRRLPRAVVDLTNGTQFRFRNSGDNPLSNRLIEVGTKALGRGLMSGETLRAPRQQLRPLRAPAFVLPLGFKLSLEIYTKSRACQARVSVFNALNWGLKQIA